MALYPFSLCLVTLLSLCTSGLGEPVCPYTWSRPVSNSSDNCTCGDGVRGRVFCDEDRREVGVLLSYCMTYDTTSNETVIGSCPFFPIANSRNGYTPLPKYVRDLNQAVCGPLNREGRLCGECRSGYAPGALSYDHECAKCDISPAGRWIVFLLYQFVPVTVFFFIVLIFKLEIISGPLTAFVFFAQVYSSPENIRLLELLGREASGIDTKSFLNFHKVLVTIYGIWNLDFGRAYLADVCLEERITTIKTIAMELIEPFYLILLIALTITVVELHGRGFKPVVIVWKPLTACFSKFKKDWKITDSLIRTIATFLLLAYTRLVVVSIRILDGTILYNIDGYRVALVPYYSTENDYFHGEHAAFAAVAILTVCTLVAIPPIILLLYPFRKCHDCMGVFCSPRLQYGLRTFVESFQGSYKDGSLNRFDLRYVAGWYFVLRVIVAVGGEDNAFFPHFGREGIALALFITAVGIALLRPYKKYALNLVDTFHFVILSLIYWLLLNNVYLTLLNRGNHVLGLIAFLSVLPCVYAVAVIIHWVCFIKKYPQWLYMWFQSKCMGKSDSMSLPMNIKEPSTQTPSYQLTSDYVEASFADRLANPTTYDVLIPSRQKVLARAQQMTSVNEKAQTSGEFFSDQVSSFSMIHDEEEESEEESVEKPRIPKPPTTSVIELEGSGWEMEGGGESLEVVVPEEEL